MEIDVLLFATLKDRAGQSRVTVTVSEGATINDVRKALAERYPDMEVNLEYAIASLNRDFTTNSDPVQAGDEVAFFPPVSGGSPEKDEKPELFLLPDEPVSHDSIVEAVTTPGTGAVAVFSGIVRGKTNRDGHLPDTQYLEYEAYEPMAIAKMKQVAAEIREQWPLVQGIAIVQRVGRLSVGDNTILIACSAAHRDQGCFEAARYGIDRLKEIVPVWKKELSDTGSVWVEGDYQPTPSDRDSSQVV